MSLFLLLTAVLVPSPEGKDKVLNFALLDHRGEYHELHYFQKDKQTRLIVLFVQGNGCPLVRKRVPELNQLRDRYREKGVRFWMLNANPQDGRDDVAEEAREYGITWPILLDDTQIVARSLGIGRTAEAIVVDPRRSTIVYRGAVDDRLGYDSEKPKAGKVYLKRVLDAVLAGKEPPVRRTEAPGCKITFVDGKEAEVSYSRTVAPILLNRCVRCHQKGAIGPFALSSHKKVRGWSEMIRETVMTRRMPPWQADPHYSDFSNDMSMTVEEKSRLIRWIDSGCVKKDGEPDPLADRVPKAREWALGEPDYIVTIPTQKIPATGVVPYRHLTQDLPFDKDVWVRALQISPGNTRVLHHVIVSAVRDDKKRDGDWIGGYAPGTEEETYAEGSGRLIRKGAKLLFQLHYTVSGKPETDTTRVGLYFHKTRPKKLYRSGLVVDRKFEIPPHARAFPAKQGVKIKRDIILYRMFPHMHFRGKSMRYEAHYADGRKEILLSVPNYHFNWQRGYVLKEPKRLPAGTFLVVQAAWDNSELNPHNPDPSKAVRWGDQSWEEMFFAPYSFTYAD